MRKRRKEKGSVIAFSTVLALVLVLLGVAFVFLLMYMGGQHETKNATDAGALNVGKQALDDIKVTLNGGQNEQIYYDVTNDVDDGSKDNDGNITLRRINRVWAQAMLIGINADAMSSDGLGGSSSNNASQAFSGAESISNRLTAELTNPNKLYGYFDDYSKANSVRMIGNTVETNALHGSNWKTSLMDRTPITSQARESNITVSNGPNNGMPPGYSLSSSYTTASTRSTSISSSNNRTFLKGYTPLNVAGNTIWQVPFQYDEKPRLVSRTVFDQSTNSANPLSWNNAVPNAFSVEGQAVKASAASEKAMSWVLTNPRESFQMAIPHSFLKIHLDEMKAHWYFFPTGYPPIEFGSATTYGYTMGSGSMSMPQGGAFCSLVSSGSVELGSDVVGRSLDEVIFSIPSGDTDLLERHMVNRINEMLTKVGSNKTASDLHSVLGQVWTRGDLAAGGESGRDFYVYSKDGVDLNLASDQTIFTAPLWLQTMVSQDPDGDEKKMVDDASSFSPIFFDPTATPDPFCTVDFTFGWGTWEKDLYWKPGSGYNGDLGQVRVKRWTNVYSFGLATPVI